jgi:hypothetical protein
MKTVHGRTVNISEGGISDLRLARTGGYTQNPGPRVDECKRDISTISEDGSSFTLAVSRKRRSQQTTEASRLPRLNQVANTDAGACHALRSIERDS